MSNLVLVESSISLTFWYIEGIVIYRNRWLDRWLDRCLGSASMSCFLESVENTRVDLWLWLRGYWYIDSEIML